MLTGCIVNDIPYPIIEARITGFAAENMEGNARINSNDHTVSFTVDDAVDLKRLRITKLEYTENATLSMDNNRYDNKDKFPEKPFSSLEELPLSANTRVDMSSPLKVRLTTYQDYDWTITASQHVDRTISVEGQVGNAVIDDVNRNVVIYVSKETKLNAVCVSDFSLGGKHGTVVPDPTDKSKYADGFDFEQNKVFYVKHGWEETSHKWNVLVYNSDVSVVKPTASAFARTVSATISITNAGQNVSVEYQKAGSSAWTSATDLRSSGNTMKAELKNLTPNTTYTYRINNGDATGTFTTTEATPLPNGSLDEWTLDGKLWIPGSKSGESFWDTGNKGATTIAESNSHPTEDTWNGKGQAACLESKYLVLKFAAGNLFSGTYVKTDGTNGILDFGRPFTAFPTKLRFHYKYRGSDINRIGDDDLSHLKGTPDIGTVYILLTDWEKPYTIKTRKSERSLLDTENDEHIIAYSVMETSETTTTYKEYTLPINYRVTDRKPKYIVVVASSSKYGDYFVGGDTSCMWIDDMELLYE